MLTDKCSRVRALLGIAFLAGLAAGCQDIDPVGPPGQSGEVRLDALVFGIESTAPDAIRLSIPSSYERGTVFEADQTVGGFAPGGPGLQADVHFDVSKPLHTFELHLGRAHDERSYIYVIADYRPAYAQGFTEEELVSFGAPLYDHSLSPDGQRLFYLLLTPSSGTVLHAYDLTTHEDVVIPDGHNWLSVRAASSEMLFTTLPVPGEPEASDRAMLVSYAVGVGSLVPVAWVSSNYARLSEVVDGLLVTNQPIFEPGPSGIIVDVASGNLLLRDIDWVALRPHTRDRIWTGNSWLDPSTRDFVPVTTNPGFETAILTLSSDNTIAVGVEALRNEPTSLRLVVYRNGARWFNDTAFHFKSVHVVEGSQAHNQALLFQQTGMIEAPLGARVANGYYRLDPATQSAVLVHSASASQADYELADGSILSLREQGLYRLIP